MASEIREKINEVVKTEEDYEPNSSISKNVNMIFVDEYNGLREIHYSYFEKPLGGESFQEISTKLIRSRFKDPHFDLYDKSSLFSKEGTHEIYNPKNEIQVWRFNKADAVSLCKIFRSYFLFAMSSPNPLQPVQGQLNNLYFTAAVAAVAERPKMITRLFITESHNSQGLYLISLCIQARMRAYVVDDKFYYIEKYHDENVKKEYEKKKRKQHKTNKKSEYIKAEFLFGYSEKNDLWFSFLEKAYAKAYGCYWNMGVGGRGDEALMDLTGAPSEHLRIGDFVPTEGYIGEKESIPESKKVDYEENIPNNMENKFRAFFRRIFFCLKFGYIVNAGVKGTGFGDIGNGLRAGMR